MKISFGLIGRPSVRRTLWRFGRGLYRLARGDGDNNIATNGETYVQSVACRHASPGNNCILDVGANVGEWTEQLIKNPMFTSQIVAHAFEPVPATRALLLARIKHPQVSVHPMALSDRDGETQMSTYGMDRSGVNSLLTAANEPGTTTVDVALCRMDTFAKERNIREILLAKCDAEGHDLFVIRGARGLLEEGKIALLQFEYNSRWVYAGAHLRDVFVEVKGLPYVVAKVLSDRIEIYPEWHFELEHYFEGNYLLVRSDAISWFSAHTCMFDSSNRPLIAKA